MTSLKAFALRQAQVVEAGAQIGCGLRHDDVLRLHARADDDDARGADATLFQLVEGSLGIFLALVATQHEAVGQAGGGANFAEGDAADGFEFALFADKEFAVGVTSAVRQPAGGRMFLSWFETMPISTEPKGPACRQTVGAPSSPTEAAAAADAAAASDGAEAAVAMAWASASEAALAEGMTSSGGKISSWSASCCWLSR